MTFRLPYMLPACIAAVTMAKPAMALTVFDPGNYAQNVLSASRALEQINNQIKALQNQAQSLLNQAKNLQNLDYSSLKKLQDNISRTQMLLNDAQHISFNVKNIDEQFRTLYGEADLTASDKRLIEDAKTRWHNSVGGLQDSMRVQAQAVGNMETSRQETGKLVEASQNATGALQATQAGNQLLGLLATQISDVIALNATTGRAVALQEAERAAAAEQGREQRRRFLTPGPGYGAGK